jgi:hypothetical protein
LRGYGRVFATGKVMVYWICTKGCERFRHYSSHLRGGKTFSSAEVQLQETVVNLQ